MATIVAAPTVTANSGSRAQNAPTMTIAGTNCSTTPANNTVAFSLGAIGNVTAATATQLTVTFSTQPTSTGNLMAVVTSNGGSSGAAVQVATVVAAPTVTANTSNLAQNAPTITIAGTNFSTTPANNTVVFSLGAIGNVTAATATQLTVTFSTQPTAMGSLTANVIVFGGSSGATQVATIVGAPAVTPNTANLVQSAPTITISGTNFSATAGNNAVAFNLGAFGNVTAATTTQLTVTFSTQPTALGSLTAVVTSNGGTSGAAVQVAKVIAPPTVTTPTSETITQASATLGGNVASDGGDAITERGVVYSITSANNNPLIGGSGVTKVTSAGTLGVFTVSATGLTSGTGYSFKAYAINSAGTTYTTPVFTFTTLTSQEAWRQQYFGITTNTGNAADTADPDGDGNNNLFEYVAGLAPNDALSLFKVRVEAVNGHPTWKAIIFSPLVAGRTYVVKYKTSLTDTTWLPLTNITTSDNQTGTERTVTDLGAAGPKFYEVEITLP